MKKTISILILSLLIAGVFTGCSTQTEPQKQTSSTTVTTMIGNPWSTWDSIEEAETAVGFEFGLPEVIAESYNAVTVRTMQNEMIEVVYRNEDVEVCVRKQKGEGQDISGDYNQYETCTETNLDNDATLIEHTNSNNNAIKQLLSCNGYSWSLVAQDGYSGISNLDFVNMILEQK